MNVAVQFIQDLAVIVLSAAVAGLLCKRAGLSPIVGYLIAGILVGPYTPPRGLIGSVDRVELFAQIGMVFLMFGIGLGFSLRRVRQLGLTMVAVTAGTAMLVFTLARLGGFALGLDRAGTAFFAGMIVVSSSVVIGKMLNESGRSHEKSSQLALGVTLCEDLVAIVMLTLLGYYAHFGPEHAPIARGELLRALGLFAGFVFVLAIVGLLLVPKMLSRFSRDANVELETLFVAGLLFGLSFLVVRAGYSLALGSFLLGAIIAETPQRPSVERAFAGLRDLFGAVFFVAIGMTIDWQLLPAALVPLSVMTILALVGRTMVAGSMLILFGYTPRTAWSAGLLLTPLGEFSFIIAQLGIGSALLPPEYMGAAVGAALLTALISPVLGKYNGEVANFMVRHPVPVLSPMMALHRRLLDNLQRRVKGSTLWKVLRRRVIQIVLETAFIGAALAFARPMIEWVVRNVGPRVWLDISTTTACWTALGLLLVAPLIAIVRNLGATAMIVADYAVMQGASQERFRTVITFVVQSVGIALLLFWIWNFVPGEARIWSLLAVAMIMVGMALLLWRRFVGWHSTLEISLEASIGESTSEIAARKSNEWSDRYAPLGLQVGEIVLPDSFRNIGRSIGEIGVRSKFGCTVIGIDRHSFTIPNPGPGTHLYPGDRLLVLGTSGQIAETREHLLAPPVTDGVPNDAFRDLALETISIPDGSVVAGQSLAELQWAQQIGVQVVGWWRGENGSLNPPATTRFGAGDRLLILGTPSQMRTLRRALVAS